MLLLLHHIPDLDELAIVVVEGSAVLTCSEHLPIVAPDSTAARRITTSLVTEGGSGRHCGVVICRPASVVTGVLG